MTRPTPGVQVLLLALVIRLFVAAVVPLHPDEAYYWEWSRHLATGYFDHPPLIAWLIRAGTILLGDTPIGVRLPAVLAGFVAGLAVMRIASVIASQAAADAAALAFVALPVMSGAFLLATPDAPLLLFSALTLWAVSQAVTVPPAASMRWWVVAGFCCGLAMASKYTGIIVPAGLLLGAVSLRSLRGIFRTPGPYVAVLAAAVVFLPVLQWNAQHDWSSFGFQLSHGLGGSIDPGAWRRELELFGGQLLLASPVLFILGVLATRQAVRAAGRVERLLAGVVILTVVLFASSALRSRVEANWPALGWVPVAVLLGATGFAGVTPRWRRIGLGLGFLFTTVLYLQSVTHFLPVSADRDQSARAFGWADLAAAVDSGASSSAKRSWVAANRYQDAAELAFNLSDHPPVFSLNLGSRDNQYRYWPGFHDAARTGDDLLLVVADQPDSVADPAVAALTPMFGSVEKGALVTMTWGSAIVGSRRLWLLRDWRGAWPRSAQ